jgi:glyoxylate reductase
MRVLITRKIHLSAKLLLEAAGFEVVTFMNNEPLDPHYLNHNIDKFDAVLTCVSEKINRELIVKSKSRLKIISNMAVGLDNIDVESAREFGIRVYNTPDVVTGPTADMTIAMAFALLRKLSDADKFIRNGYWKAWDPEIFLGRNFNSLVWGILGYGNIGKAVAKRLVGFDMKVLFYDPLFCKSDDIAISKSLIQILEESDIVSLHLPLNKETQNLINLDKLKIMKRDSVILNMARGGIINSDDLLTALEKRIIAGAALDVFAPEPIPAGNRILLLQNVLLTPHIGTATVECRKEMAEYAAMNIINNLKPN